MFCSWGIVVAMFNIVIFDAFKNRGNNFWFAYGFTMAVFVIQIGAYFLAYMKKSAKNEIVGYPITLFSMIYLVIQSVTALIFMSAQNINTRLVVIVQVLLLGGYLLVLIMLLLGKEIIKDTDAATKLKTDFIKSLLIEVECLNGKTDDAVLNKQLSALADTVKYSDPMSNETLIPLENRTEAKVTELGMAIDNNDIETAKTHCKTIEQLIAERNKKSKMLK